MSTRRKFLTGSVGVAAGALTVPALQANDAAEQSCETEIFSLCGEWQFRTDPENAGTKYTPPLSSTDAAVLPEQYSCRYWDKLVQFNGGSADADI